MDSTIPSVIDYGHQLDLIIENLDRLLYINSVLLNVTLFILGVSVAVGVCYVLYKAIKQLF